MSLMKKCPACAEEVLAEAKRCKHCGKKFPEKLTPGTAVVGVLGGLGIIVVVLYLLIRFEHCIF